MKTLIPLYKIPVTAAFALVKLHAHPLTCPSCEVKRPHWWGYTGGDARVAPYTYVCLHCGQVSRDAKEHTPSYYTIRIAVRSASEVKAVRRILRGRADIWKCIEIIQPDGTVYLQWGAWKPVDAITTAFRAAGFRATWEEVLDAAPA